MNSFANATQLKLSQDTVNIIKTKSRHLRHFCSDYFAHSGIKALSYTLLTSAGKAFVIHTNMDYLANYMNSSLPTQLYDEITKSYPYQGYHMIDGNDELHGEPKDQYKELLSLHGLGQTCVIANNVNLEDEHAIALITLHGNRDNNQLIQYYMNCHQEITSICQGVHDRFVSEMRTVGHIKYKLDSNLPLLRPFKQSSSCEINQFSSISNRPKRENVHLTNRQLEMVYWYFKGKTAKQTAEILGISRRTVEEHFANICRRLKVSSKHQAMLIIMDMFPYIFQETNTQMPS